PAQRAASVRKPTHPAATSAAITRSSLAHSTRLPRRRIDPGQEAWKGCKRPDHEPSPQLDGLVSRPAAAELPGTLMGFGSASSGCRTGSARPEKILGSTRSSL